MSPITHVLQKLAEEIPCSTIIPPLYYVNNQWISLNPHPPPSLPPSQLTVDAEPKFNFKTISSIATGGLYTQKEIRQAQEAIMFGIEKNALNNLLTKKISIHASQEVPYSALHLFNKEELEQLAQSTANYLWGWFYFIGTYTSGILGLYFICRVFKFIFEVILNALAIHKTHGCALHLFASLWDTMTLFVLQRYKPKDKNQLPEIDAKPENILTESTAPNEDDPPNLQITVNTDGSERQVEEVPPAPYATLNQQAQAIHTPYLQQRWI